MDSPQLTCSVGLWGNLSWVQNVFNVQPLSLCYIGPCFNETELYKIFYLNTVKCHYNTVQSNLSSSDGTAIAMAESESDFKIIADNISTSQVSHGVSIVRIWEKIDHVLTALRCTYPDSKLHGANMGPTWGPSQ